MADPILVVHFFEPLEWSAKLGGHDLDMLGDVAVLARVRVIRFEDENIASVYVATESLTKRREWAIIQQLPSMTLAVAKRVVGFLAAREVAAGLRLEDRSQRSAGIVLSGMSDAPTAVEPRSLASLESADSRLTVEGPQRPQRLAFPLLLIMSWTKFPRNCRLITALERALRSDMALRSQRPQ